MSTLELNRSSRAIADAAGVAEIRLSPPMMGEVWHIFGIAVSNNDNTNNPSCKVYKNLIAPTTRIAGTINGISDTCVGEEFIFAQGDTIIIRWEGCVVGSISSANIWGKRNVYGAGFATRGEF